MQHLGFVTDPHQICVGITRAKFGLIIVGESLMLYCTLMEVVSMHAYESSRTHTYGSRGNCYHAKFVLCELHTKLAQSSFEVGPKIARSSFEVGPNFVQS